MALSEHEERVLREIEETAAANRMLASSALGRVRRSIDALTGAFPTTVYDSSGHLEGVTTVPVRLDEAL